MEVGDRVKQESEPRPVMSKDCTLFVGLDTHKKNTIVYYQLADRR